MEYKILDPKASMVENIHVAIGYASRCWRDIPRFRWFPWIFKIQMFADDQAIALATELCSLTVEYKADANRS